MSNHINKLKDAAKGKFSEQETEDFIRMGAILASKSVLTALTYVVEEGKEKGFNSETADRLINRIKGIMPFDYSGFTHITITGMDIRLNICLSICERNYKTEIDVPDDKNFIKDLFEQYEFLKRTAIAYWKQFQSDQPDIFQRVCDYRSDLDLNDLIVDATNTTTLYFDPDCKKRIGILCYYVDKSGRPFAKKTGKK